MSHPRPARSSSAPVPPSRRAVLGGAGLLAALGLAGCDLGSAPSPGASGSAGGSGGGSGGKVKKGGTFRLGMAGGNSASRLDAHRAPDGMSSNLSTFFYSQLTRRNPSFELVNDLAEELTASEDAVTWTLRLKEDVPFHDGRTVSAEDVIASFTRVLDPATAATVGGQVAMIKTMTAVDPLTVRFDLSAPTGWFDVAVGDTGLLGIVPADYDVSAPISTGPFRFESFEPGVSARFTRFEDYHLGAPLLEAVEVTILNDDSARFNALQAGQIDAAYGLTPAQAAQVEGGKALSLYDLPSGQFTPMTMRTDEGPTADVRVRQALRMCLDREQVLASAFGGRGRVAHDLYGPDDEGYPEDLVREQDLEGAKALVAEAGAEGLEITLTVGDLGGTVQAATVLAQNASGIGLKVTVDKVDTATLFGDNYLSWPMAVDSYPALGYLAVAAISDGPAAVINQTHFVDPEYQALFEKASATVDETERGKIVAQAQKILFERGGYIIPVFSNTLIGLAPTVGGYSEENKTGLEQFRDLATIGFRA